jgi:host factor-I protein
LSRAPAFCERQLRAESWREKSVNVLQIIPPLIMADFDTTLPSIRQIQNIIKDKKQVQVKLLTGELLAGQVLWQDKNCLCIVESSGQQTFVWRQAIAYVKPNMS